MLLALWAEGATGAVVTKNQHIFGDYYMRIDSLHLFLRVSDVMERMLKSELWDLSQYLAIDCVTLKHLLNFSEPKVINSVHVY